LSDPAPFCYVNRLIKPKNIQDISIEACSISFAGKNYQGVALERLRNCGLGGPERTTTNR